MVRFWSSYRIVPVFRHSPPGPGRPTPTTTILAPNGAVRAHPRALPKLRARIPGAEIGHGGGPRSFLWTHRVGRPWNSAIPRTVPGSPPRGDGGGGVARSIYGARARGNRSLPGPARRAITTSESPHPLTRPEPARWVYTDPEPAPELGFIARAYVIDIGRRGASSSASSPRVPSALAESSSADASGCSVGQVGPRVDPPSPPPVGRARARAASWGRPPFWLFPTPLDPGRAPS